MNLYIAKWIKSNTIHSWIHREYVVAESFDAVAEKYKEATSIKLKQAKISILNKE